MAEERAPIGVGVPTQPPREGILTPATTTTKPPPVTATTRPPNTVAPSPATTSAAPVTPTTGQAPDTYGTPADDLTEQPGLFADLPATTGVADDVINPFLQNVYLATRGPESAFETLINVLLDNKVHFVTLYSSGAITDPAVDPFGLGYQWAGVPQGEPDIEGPYRSFGTDSGAGKVYGQFDVLDMTVDADREWLRKYRGAEIGYAPGPPEGRAPGVPGWGERNLAIEQGIEEWIDLNLGPHRYVYLAPDADPEDDATHIGMIASYDGTPFGTINNIGQALSGMRLDRPSIDNYMTNLSRENRHNYRGIQAQLAWLGYYGDNLNSVVWGSAQDVDRVAFANLTQDLVNEHLRTADLRREESVGGKTPITPETTVQSFMTRKFLDTQRGWRQTALDTDDPLVELQGDITKQVTTALEQAWSGTGRTVTPAIEAGISAAINGLYAQGDLEVADLMNTDLTGFAAYDMEIALADAFNAAYFGEGIDDANWAKRIHVGVEDSPGELIRLAAAAGVDVTKQTGTRPGAPPEILGQITPLTGLSEEQLKNLGRHYFLQIFRNMGKGDLVTTANIFANTFGHRRFAEKEYDSEWLAGVTATTRAPGTFASQVGARTLEEQSTERQAALSNAEDRVLAAMNINKNQARENLRTRVMYDVLRTLSPTVKVRKPRT